MTINQILRGRMGYGLLGAPLLILSLAACGGDATGGTGGGGGTGQTGEPLYAYRSAQYAPDFSARTDYLKFTKSLSADAKPDESKSIELKTEGAVVVASPNPGEFFATDAGAGRVVKYSVGADGTVQEAASFSLSHYGVTSFPKPALMAIASKTKAYLVDFGTKQGFVWDPSMMTIVSNADLSMGINNMENGKELDETADPNFVQVGNKFVSVFYYFDRATFTSSKRSAVIMVDADTDKFSVVENANCPGFANTVVNADGYVYIASGHYAAAEMFGAMGPAPCLVRFDPKTSTFDSTYNVDLAKLVGKPAGSMVEGAGNSVYVWALDQSLIPAGTMPVPFNLLLSPVWVAYRIDDVTNPQKATASMAPSPGYLISAIRVDKKTYIVDTTVAPKNQTVLLDTAMDPPASAFTDAGWIAYMVRVR